jgi:hypothetical protein
MNDALFSSFVDELVKMAAVPKGTYEAMASLRGPVGHLLRKVREAGLPLPSSLVEPFPKKLTTTLKRAPVQAPSDTAILSEPLVQSKRLQPLPTFVPKPLQREVPSSSGWAMGAKELRRLPSAASIKDVASKPSEYGAKVAALLKVAALIAKKGAGAPLGLS